MFLPVVSCHGHGVKGITLASEHRGSLKKRAVCGDELCDPLRRWWHGVAQEREDEEMAISPAIVLLTTSDSVKYW